MCAPAPISDPPADSRMTVGNSSASARTMRSLSTRSARARNSGNRSAALPEVDGMMKAVAAITPVRPTKRRRTVPSLCRIGKTRRSRRPLARSTAEMMKAATSSQISSWPSAANSFSVLSTPVAASANAAASPTSVSPMRVTLQPRTASVRSISAMRPSRDRSPGRNQIAAGRTIAHAQPALMRQGKDGLAGSPATPSSRLGLPLVMARTGAVSQAGCTIIALQACTGVTRLS